MKTVLNVAGARPNFMKIAPLMREMNACKTIRPILVHTGQHYDEKMSKLFFNDLGIPSPDVNLEVGSGSHAAQTAEVMIRFERVLLEFKPDIVTVVGDVNSTIACALTAVKMGVRVAHVEAGLRSFDRTMPEEINRILTDSISEFLFVSERSGLRNLKFEGIHDSKVHFVGNVMIDSLLSHRERAKASDILDKLELQPKRYATVTLHRPSNVDDSSVFSRILDALAEIQAHLPIVFPAHPRTLSRLKAFGFEDRLKSAPSLRVIEPLGYLDFLKLMDNAKIVLTDSGGIQEETTVLGVPCITLRENTERPVTVEIGTNVLVGADTQKIVAECQRFFNGSLSNGKLPELWDGQAARRIVEILDAA